MIFEQFEVGNMDNYCYLFADKESKKGFIIDPAFDAEKILATIKRHGIRLTHIILTHHHYDHVNATRGVKDSTKAVVLCHKKTAELVHGQVDHDGLLEDGDNFEFGKNSAKILHTPGHAPGSICLIIENKWLITGDTLFVGDCGRADLEGSNPRDLFNSLQKIKELPDHLVVCPGHNYGPVPTRALGEEKRLNPALKAATLNEFMGIP